MIPRGALDDTNTRIVLHVATTDRPTVRSVAAAVGLTPTPTYGLLLYLRDHGFVTWEAGRTGTLRALVAPRPLAERVR